MPLACHATLGASSLPLVAALLAADPRPAPRHVAPSPAARAVVDTAIARMGGRVALDSLRTVQYEIATQWLALAPDAQPRRDGPSYERQSEWRDYRQRIWRNVRRFPTAALGWQESTDLVLDTIPARRFADGIPAAVTVATPALPVDGWAPLTVAYVAERRELFAWAPERLLVALREAPDLAARVDTVIGGERHAVVSATIDGLPFTAFLRRSTGLPTAVRFRADERNDFGLAPYGPMEVEVWYSRWAPNASGRVVVPRQWDTKRIGRPYKRMTVLAATFNVPMPADSIALPDSVRAPYLALGRRPMGDVPLDSATLVANGAVVAFHGPGARSVAVPERRGPRAARRDPRADRGSVKASARSNGWVRAPRRRVDPLDPRGGPQKATPTVARSRPSRWWRRTSANTPGNAGSFARTPTPALHPRTRTSPPIP